MARATRWHDLASHNTMVHTQHKTSVDAWPPSLACQEAQKDARQPSLTTIKKTFQNPGTRRERHGRWSPEFGAVITLPRSQSGTSQSGSTGLSCVRVHGEGHKAYHRRGLVFSVSSSLLCLDDTQISTKIGRLTRTAPSLRDMIISLMPRIMKSPILYGRRRHKMCPLSGVGDPVAFGLVVLLSC